MTTNTSFHMTNKPSHKQEARMEANRRIIDLNQKFHFGHISEEEFKSQTFQLLCCYMDLTREEAGKLVEEWSNKN